MIGSDDFDDFHVASVIMAEHFSFELLVCEAFGEILYTGGKVRGSLESFVNIFDNSYKLINKYMNK